MQTSLKGLIQQMIPPTPEIVVGTVKNAELLTVEINGDGKAVVFPLFGLPLRESGLSVGDQVYVLPHGGGYYALDRV